MTDEKSPLNALKDQTVTAEVQQTGSTAAPAKAKRKVALHVAYCGSGFQGLQLQRGVEEITTVEAALENAIAKAGGILESNMGALHKIDWSRSSRTDKGVHSCATVIGLKMECVVESFESDPEGLGIAAEINRYLPGQVRVLSVQRTNQKFDARQICEGRVYSYFLPTSIVGLQLDGGEQDRERMRLLRECLALFEGVRPFHNFTKRRLYRAPQRQQAGRRGKRKATARALPGVQGLEDHQGTGSSSEEDDGDEEGASSKALEAIDYVITDMQQSSSARGVSESLLESRPASAGVKPQGSTAEAAVEGKQAAEGLQPSATVSEDGGQGAPWRRGTGLQMLHFRWNEDRDDADPITRSHFRHVYSATADNPAPLVAGGTPCIKVVFSGQSFMLHQIRHMVGAAVAVARGAVPLAWVEACLHSPSRAIMPLAPPHVLVLSETIMMRWRDEQARAMLAHTTGDRLALRDGGMAAQQAFLSQVLYPAINELLQAEDWERWETTLQRTAYDEDHMAAFLASHAESKARLEQRRAERAAHSTAAELEQL
ncbi:probable tRNA pseudouridine synthase 1 at N-terminal half [Coccomyxa sp. Obi]|nr:probable tRNA pseudouridine synthase 1 at N-terminal half [Coccomyxa sp. Obi]